MEEEKKKSKKSRYIVIGTGVGLLGLGLFALWKLKWSKGVSVDDPAKDLFIKASDEGFTKTGKDTTDNTPPSKTTEKTTFPLRKGDKGTLVKHLQTTLLETYGADILPKYGADGDYGTELLTALKSKGYPEVIDEATYKKILAGKEAAPEENETASNSPSSSPEPSTPAPSASGKKKTITTKQAVDVAKNIWLNITLKKLQPMTTTLKRMHNVLDYSAVNTLFKTIRTNGVHQTIVNAVLNAFSDDATSKQMITGQFERMGLKYDGEKWSLSGIQRKQLITTRETTIRDNRGMGLDVPEQTLLGEVISDAGQITTFRTIDDQILYVPTKHVSHV